ncbi:hypothetical protein FSARC_1170 [Fusarium sarcochroum]|uniref:Caspase n=1 Tax=Fusarium sarcochroum TaxID=1208366 RepID=A0A8H4UA59_9HYPO|nr:hypothetical protein FSARC_1170 [Fusarium sarcochroum]
MANSMSLKEFDTAIDRACHYYRERDVMRTRYKRARVLCVYFEKDNNLGHGSTSERVRAAFEKYHGYESVCLMIPEQDDFPQRTLISALHKLLHDMGDDCLAVLHYIGQSQPNSGRLHFAALGSSQNLDFHELRYSIVDPSPANILILLDCCYGDAGTNMGQRKELIAACSFEEQLTGGPGGFSNNLVCQLENAHNCSQIITASQLYGRLAARHFVKGSQPELAAVPIFQRRHEQAPSLLLRPMVLSSDTYWSPGISTGVRLQAGNVILSSHLRDTNIERLGSMQGYREINGDVKVDRVYKSTSQPSTSLVVILVVTFKAWYGLSDHPSIKFIGFECNQHAAPFDRTGEYLKQERRAPTKPLRGPGYDQPLFKPVGKQSKLFGIV